MSSFSKRTCAIVRPRSRSTSSLPLLVAVPSAHARRTNRDVQCAYRNLRNSGRLVADLTMPNLAAYADSMQTPPRAVVEIDIDTRDPNTGTRLLRFKTTRYLPHEQRAEIRFLYDKFPDGERVDRYVSDLDCHVYYPREVELLFRVTGFFNQGWFGDYAQRALRATSRQLIGVGRKAVD
jgi:hypothetical protein